MLIYFWKMMNKSSIFTLLVIVIGTLLCVFISFKAMFLYFGIFCALMFFNITLSTMTNVLSGAAVERNDTFWRIVMIVLASLFIGLTMI